MKLFRRNKSETEEIVRTKSESDIEYNYEIVGESFGRDHLLAIIRESGAKDIGEIHTEAILQLEPTNEFDPTAVQVLISELHVGYIPKHDSETVTRMIVKSGSNRYKTFARIGWDTDNPQPLIGVTINLEI